MTISDMINNSQPTNNPTVLNPVWTNNKEFCCPMMGPEQMVTDMVEAQDLIAALSVAEIRGVAIPKFKATECPYSMEESGWNAINVEIMSPVTDDFMTVLEEVQSGILAFKDVSTDGNVRWIQDSANMKLYTLSLQDNLNIINATLN